LGVHQDVPIGLGFGVELGRHQHVGAIERSPGFPTGVLESEHVPGLRQVGHVDPQRLTQVRSHLTEHLIGLGDFHRVVGFVEPECLAEAGDDADVGPRAGRPPQIDGDSVGGPMVQGAEHALAAGERGA